MTKRHLTGALATALLLAACGSDNDDDPMPMPDPDPMETRGFTIEVTNLTAGQPLSPLAVIAHSDEFELFTVGAPASVELEQLAEGGDNSSLLTMADDNEEVHATASTMEPLAPGASEVLTLSVEAPPAALDNLLLGLVSMLVNTNDAITAIRAQPLGRLEIDDTMVLTALSYDTGTEANTEAVDHIPGPAAAGGAQEGFNETRDDIDDRVHLHPGIIGQEQGLSTSVLTQNHRWDHPVIRVIITRTE